VDEVILEEERSQVHSAVGQLLRAAGREVLLDTIVQHCLADQCTSYGALANY
jgi:hypothetical protein